MKTESEMIYGTYTVALDTQGRFIVPSDWIPLLGENVIIARGVAPGNQHFLTVYPLEYFEETLEDFAHNAPSDTDKQALSRKYLRYTYAAKIDAKKRRLSIPSSNITYAGLGNSVLITPNCVAKKPIFEVWDPDTFEDADSEMSDDKYREELKKNAEEWKAMR